MGCCGCTLQTSAIVAAVFGVIESVSGFIGGIAFLVNWHFISTVKNVIISSTVFNAFWLIATIILIIGIVNQNAVMHRIWVGVTSVIMIVDLAHTIALIVVIAKGTATYSKSVYNYSYDNGYAVYNSYYSNDLGWLLVILLLTLVSRGSVWLWIVNICLTIYTAHRANEIERGPMPTGTTVTVFGPQPGLTYVAPGQPIIIQHQYGGGPSMPPAYDQQQQQPQYMYPGQPPVAPYGGDQGVQSKH